MGQLDDVLAGLARIESGLAELRLTTSNLTALAGKNSQTSNLSALVGKNSKEQTNSCTVNHVFHSGDSVSSKLSSNSTFLAREVPKEHPAKPVPFNVLPEEPLSATGSDKGQGLTDAMMSCGEMLMDVGNDALYSALGVADGLIVAGQDEAAQMSLDAKHALESIESFAETAFVEGVATNLETIEEFAEKEIYGEACADRAQEIADRKKKTKARDKSRFQWDSEANNGEEIPAGEVHDALLNRTAELTHAFLKTKNWLPHAPKPEEMAAQKLKETAAAQKLIDDGQNPPHHSYTSAASHKLKDSMVSGSFDAVSAIFILLNAAFMASRIELDGHRMGNAAGLDGAWNIPDEATKVYEIVEYFFVAIFTFELLLRVHLLGRQVFRECWNYLDIMLVIFSYVELISTTSESAGVGRGALIFRCLRLARLTKTFRLARLMKSFRQLRVLVRTIASGVGAMFWCVILVGTIEAVAAVLLSMSLQQYLIDDTLDDDMREWVWKYFGTFTKAFYTMFEVTFNGWQSVSRPMIHNIHICYAFFWVPYACIVYFTIMRVVGAIFIKETFAQSSKESETNLQEQFLYNPGPIIQLRQLLGKYAENAGGEFTPQEFGEALADKDIKKWLTDFDVDESRLAGLFEMIDSGDGQVTIEEFIAGVFSLHGSGQAADNMSLLYVSEKIITWIQLVHMKVEECTRQHREVLPLMKTVKAHVESQQQQSQDSQKNTAPSQLYPVSETEDKIFHAKKMALGTSLVDI